MSSGQTREINYLHAPDLLTYLQAGTQRVITTLSMELTSVITRQQHIPGSHTWVSSRVLYMPWKHLPARNPASHST